METKFTKEEKYVRAKKRVEELKGFYIHFGVYILVNLFLSIRNIYEGIEDGEELSSLLFDVDLYWVWIFWGVGLFSHAMKVFSAKFFLGGNWEERKIKEYMDNNDKV